MSNYQHFINLVIELSGQKNTMTIPRIYIKIAGDITAGVFLSQLVWYSDKGTRKDGWFWKSNKEWKEEIELSYAQVKRCTRDLEARGFIETKVMRAKGAPTTHYKVDMDAIIEAMIKEVTQDSPILEKVEKRKSRKSNLEKVENENLDKPEKHEQHKPNINNNILEPSAQLFSELVSLLKMPKELMTPKMQRAYDDFILDLQELGAKPGDIDVFARRWYEKDWRGQKEQKPTLEQIRSEWDNLMNPHQNGTNGKVIQNEDGSYYL